MVPALAKRFLILGMANIWRHRLRSTLTVLGIVFGVCSVIAMLAIGEGASYEAQEQIKKLGSQNIIVRSVKPPQSDKLSDQRQMLTEYGLTYQDAEVIESTIPSIDVIVPSRMVRSEMFYGRKKVDGDVVGTVPWYPKIANRAVASGRFINEDEMRDHRNVCVLSAELADRLFSYEDPVNQVVRVGGSYYEVVGVMAPAGPLPLDPAGTGTALNLFIPLTAAKSRFGENIIVRRSGSFSAEKVELHEIIVKVKELAEVMGTSGVIREILERLHKKADYEIVVPLELLRQAERTKRIFSIVLGSIAAISLLVGGIGIMNIMLASVTERTREIGIRRALGAKKKDIIVQFLTETVLLSGSGGVIGLIIGISIPFSITYFAEMRTIIRLWFLFGAFGISIAIGIIFGMYPAYRAAMMNPITALRHE